MTKHIALVGMSNIGKSYWSDRLVAEAGYEKIDCDALIEKSLGDELTQHGYAGIRDVAKWMGQPFNPHYPYTSRKYIACERKVMQTAIDMLRSAPADKKFVIDTTGSVIYAGDDIIESLMALTRVIYLEASSRHIIELFDRYMAEPKPVIWDDSYAPHLDESPVDALKRCYGNLLGNRARCYEKIAAVTIPFDRHRAPADMETIFKTD